MKIVDFRTQALSIPIPNPPVGPAHTGRMEAVSPVLVRLRTDDGIEGFGYAWSFNSKKVRSIKAALDDLRDTVIGEDPFASAHLWQKLWTDTTHMGHRGLAMYAIAAIDIAVWDIVGKAVGKPLYQILGGYRDTAPVYASHRLFRSWTMDELQKDAAALVAQGYRAMKTRVGDKPEDVEVARMKAIREAVGKDIAVMVDVNWAWTVHQAIHTGRRLEEINLFWLEDPLQSDDPEGTAQVAAALEMPVCAGETYPTKADFRRLFEQRSVDILMIDAARVGGVTEFMRIAAMAQGYNLSVASHLMPEISVHLIAALPNGLTVEYMPWWDEMYVDPIRVENGQVKLSSKPGLGLELNERALDKYKIA